MSDLLTIDKKCPRCDKENSITVKKEDYEAWKRGTLIQYAFPYLTDNQREFLMNGFCYNCWEDLFTFDEPEPVPF